MAKLSVVVSVHGSGSADKRDVQILRSHCIECGVLSVGAGSLDTGL